MQLTINCLDGERKRFKYKTKSPFRRCVDNLSQNKFDNREFNEIDEALCGKKEEKFKPSYMSKRDLPFNEDIVDDECEREREEFEVNL